eukprot:6724934-Pyramimonas_sp.AAC.2
MPIRCQTVRADWSVLDCGATRRRMDVQEHGVVAPDQSAAINTASGGAAITASRGAAITASGGAAITASGDAAIINASGGAAIITASGGAAITASGGAAITAGGGVVPGEMHRAKVVPHHKHAFPPMYLSSAGHARAVARLS